MFGRMSWHLPKKLYCYFNSDFIRLPICHLCTRQQCVLTDYKDLFSADHHLGDRCLAECYGTTQSYFLLVCLLCTRQQCVFSTDFKEVFKVNLTNCHSAECHSIPQRSQIVKLFFPKSPENILLTCCQ
jgi:hypothetical protein